MFSDVVTSSCPGSPSHWLPLPHPPPPLSHLCSAPAVKKAYRKAALCVHPDKVQQKGATVQQKYIAEKVFDLLKVRAVYVHARAELGRS